MDDNDIIILLASLTLAATLAGIGVTVWPKRRRLRFDIYVERLRPNLPPCLTWHLQNPGGRPVHVDGVGLLLRDGMEVQVTVEPVTNATDRDPLPPFELREASRPRLFSRVENHLCSTLKAKGYESGQLEVRPFVRFATRKRRLADTWWIVDIDAGTAEPQKMPWWFRVANQARHFFQ